MRALNIKAGIELIRNKNIEFMIPKIPLPTNINKQNLAPLPFDIFISGVWIINPTPEKSFLYELIFFTLYFVEVFFEDFH